MEQVAMEGFLNKTQGCIQDHHKIKNGAFFTLISGQRTPS